MMTQLSDKQIAWRKYYRENRAKLLQKKKDKAALNPNYRPREERMIKRVCFNCGGVLGVAVFLLVIVNIAIWKNLYL